MDNLNKARKDIEEIDIKIAKLFEERMEKAHDIAVFKKERGIPIEDGALEEELLREKAEVVSNPVVKGYYVNFLKSAVDLSKKYQHYLAEGAKIAYSGVPGAFANIAAKQIFPDGNAIPYSDFKEAYEAVISGECDCAVLPIENSFAGDVGQVMDIGYSGPLYINGIYELHIVQNLLGAECAEIGKLKKVISHPQALAQCATYIKKHGLTKEECANTAAAAKYVAGLNARDVAAIASEETAKLYGLKILEKSINEDINNTTRFAVFSRVPNPVRREDNRFIMFFTVKHEAGTLAKVISILAENGFNLNALKSRPTRESGWEYYFYVEGEGDINSEKGLEVCEMVKKFCKNFKLAGTFNRVISLKA